MDSERFAGRGLGTYSRCRPLAGGDMQRREPCNASACSADKLDAGLLWETLAKYPNSGVNLPMDLLRRVRR